MKKTLPLILFTACSITAFAVPQYGKKISTARQQQVNAYQSILLKQSKTNAANKNTASPRPLLANSYVANGSPTDSNRYYYSNGRGSELTDPGSYLDNYFPTIDNPVQTLFTDSSTNFRDFGSGLVFTNTKYYTYGANNTVVNFKSISPYTFFSYDCTYNSAGNLQTIIISDTFGTGTLKPQSTTYIEYNAQNKRIKDSSISATGSILTSKGLKTYDANNNLLVSEDYYTIAGTLTLFSRFTNTYDASNRLILAVYEQGGGSPGLVNNYKDSFAYDGTSTKPAYHATYEWNNLSNTWRPQDIFVNTYNTAGLISSYEFYEYTTKWDTTERDVYTYDADNLLLRINGYRYKGNGTFETTPYDQTTMYYTIPTTTGVSKNVVQDNKFTIYPNPASNVIIISAALQQTGNITIYNAAGQLMTNIQAASLNRQQVDVTNYPTGNYWISVADEKGQRLYQSNFSRL